MFSALSNLIACTTCFGGGNAVTRDALNMAILTLLGIVLFVIGGFLALIYSLWKRRGNNQ